MSDGRCVIISAVLCIHFDYLYQVTRQLFEPLVMQLIHWFTNNKKFESQDTVAVLEAIMVRVYAWVVVRSKLQQQ